MKKSLWRVERRKINLPKYAFLTWAIPKYALEEKIVYSPFVREKNLLWDIAPNGSAKAKFKANLVHGFLNPRQRQPHLKGDVLDDYAHDKGTTHGTNKSQAIWIEGLHKNNGGWKKTTNNVLCLRYPMPCNQINQT